MQTSTVIAIAIIVVAAIYLAVRYARNRGKPCKAGCAACAGQVKSGQAKSGQAISGQAKPGQAHDCSCSGTETLSDPDSPSIAEDKEK